MSVMNTYINYMVSPTEIQSTVVFFCQGGAYTREVVSSSYFRRLQEAMANPARSPELKPLNF